MNTFLRGSSSFYSDPLFLLLSFISKNQSWLQSSVVTIDELALAFKNEVYPEFESTCTEIAVIRLLKQKNNPLSKDAIIEMKGKRCLGLTKAGRSWLLSALSEI